LSKWTADEDFYRLKLEEIFDLVKIPTKYESSQMSNNATSGRIIHQREGQKMSSGAGAKTTLLKELKKGKEIDAYASKMTDRIQKILVDSYNAERKSLIYYIELGQILLEAKICLGIQFNEKIVKTKVLPAKQVQRYIKLVLTRESIADYGGCKTSDDFKKLKLDERITELTEKGIEKFTDPTQAKISRMKNLKTDVKDDEENAVDYFAQVIAGDDKIFDDSKNFIKPVTPPAKVPNADKKPAKMDAERFKELYNKDMYDVIRMLHDAEKKVGDAKEAEEAAIKEAKRHRLTLDTEIKKTKKEKDLRVKVQEELNKITGTANRAKSPIDQQSSTTQ
jgi:hypothetical protein